MMILRHGPALMFSLGHGTGEGAPRPQTSISLQVLPLVNVSMGHVEGSFPCLRALLERYSFYS